MQTEEIKAKKRRNTRHTEKRSLDTFSCLAVATNKGPLQKLAAALWNEQNLLGRVGVFEKIALYIDWLIDWFLLEAQQAKNAYLQGIPNTNIKGD